MNATSWEMGRPENLVFRSAFFLALGVSETLVKREGLAMNSSTYVLGGVALIVIGAIGIYNIRDFPGLALFASVGLIAGIFMIGKGTKAF